MKKGEILIAKYIKNLYLSEEGSFYFVVKASGI